MMQRFWLAAMALLVSVEQGPALAQQLPPEATPAPFIFVQGLAPDNFPNLPNKRKRKDLLVPYGQPMREPPPELKMPQTGGNAPDELGPSARIPEAVAVSRALRAVPGAKPLDVRLLPGPRPVYAVKLRTQGQVQRVLVDATTGQILGP